MNPKDYTRRLWVVSNYSSATFIMDNDTDDVLIKNEDDTIDRISIKESLNRFYQNPNVKCYGIISSYVWNLEKKGYRKNDR